MADHERRRRRTSPGRFRREHRLAAGIAIAAVIAAIAVYVTVRTGPRQASYAPFAPPLQLPAHSRASGSPPPAADARTPVRIDIPAGGINLGLIEGDGVHVPMNLAAHYPGTAEGGSPGNAVYYAHAQPGMFQGLYRLHLGAEIRIVFVDGTQQVFHASGFERVAYNDRGVLKPTPFPELTLLTCTSYDPYTPRYIVLAT